jgi:hypothetical protein
VLFLLCAVAVEQSVALTSAHEQHQAQDHVCLVCYVGALPFLRSTTNVAVAPVLLVRWLEPPPDFEATHDALPAARTSRAPPA